MRVHGQHAKDPGNAKYWKKHSHCLHSEPETKGPHENTRGAVKPPFTQVILDSVGISVNFVALSADPRYNPGDGY